MIDDDEFHVDTEASVLPRELQGIPHVSYDGRITKTQHLEINASQSSPH